MESFCRHIAKFGIWKLVSLRPEPYAKFPLKNWVLYASYQISICELCKEFLFFNKCGSLVRRRPVESIPGDLYLHCFISPITSFVPELNAVYLSVQSRVFIDKPQLLKNTISAVHCTFFVWYTNNAIRTGQQSLPCWSRHNVVNRDTTALSSK